MVTDDIVLDPHYGADIALWIYSPIAKKWVQADDATFPRHLRLDETDPNFLRAIYWLNIGAFIFLKGINPNEESVLSPIVLPDYFCKKHGIIQDDLKEAVGNGNLAVIALSEGARNFSNESFLERKQQAVKAAQAKVDEAKIKPVSTDDVIALLKEGWQPITITTEARLKVIKRKYTLEYSDDRSQVRINGK